MGADFTTTDLSRCTFFGNNASNGSGGGLANFGQMTVTDSVFYNNESLHQGGAIHNEEVLTIRRCTLTDNTAGSYGGGIENQDRLTVEHCTICFNASEVNAVAGGGGIDTFSSDPSPRQIFLTNNIIWGNTGLGGVSEDIRSANIILVKSGANIIGSIQQTGAGSQTGPAAITSAPLVAPLGDYGGPTKSMALKPGSPARNAAVDSVATVDQRSFPIVGTPDIGAYEAGTIINFDNWVWESLPATATDPQHAPSADFDADKQTNLQEWLAVTDPADGNSFFKVTAVSLDGVTLKVTFPTVAGRSYSAEYSTDGIGWTSLGYAPGTGNVFTVSIGPLTGLPRFFARCRVKIP